MDLQQKFRMQTWMECLEEDHLQYFQKASVSSWRLQYENSTFGYQTSKYSFDYKFEAKLSDFGLARLIGRNQSHV